MKVKIVRTDEVEIDLVTCAKWFAGLDDEKQAQFFIEVAKEAMTWPSGSVSLWQQFERMGDHLRTCYCSNDLARDVIYAIHAGMTSTLPPINHT